MNRKRNSVKKRNVRVKRIKREVKKAIASVSSSIPTNRQTKSANTSLGTLQPVKKLIRLTMVDQVRQSFDGITGVKYFLMRANSVNSPGVTYNFHQPYLYDQMCSLYSKVCVYRTRFDITVTNESTAYTYDFVVRHTGTSTVSPSSYLDAFYDIERSHGMHILGIPPQQSRRLSYWVAPYKAIGKDKSEYNDELFCEQTSTNIGTYSPTNQIPVCFITTCADTTVQPYVTITFKATYYCEFFDRINVTHS